MEGNISAVLLDIRGAQSQSYPSPWGRFPQIELMRLGRVHSGNGSKCDPSVRGRGGGCRAIPCTVVASTPAADVLPASLFQGLCPARARESPDLLGRDGSAVRTLAEDTLPRPSPSGGISEDT